MVTRIEITKERRERKSNGWGFYERREKIAPKGVVHFDPASWNMSRGH